uniref:Uncharacterized protein n=1 Tax=Arundo donax TaxID=35708 RepID=A0A0A9C7I5_ARUDO
MLLIIYQLAIYNFSVTQNISEYQIPQQNF